MLGLLLGILFVIGATEGVYAWWLTKHIGEMEKTFQGQIASQQETIERFRGLMEGTNRRFSALSEEVSVTKGNLGNTQGELRRTRQMANQLAQQQKQSTEVLSSQLGQLQQEQGQTKGTVGALSTDVTGVKQEVTVTKTELAATRSELQRVIGDLGIQSDLVAHTREDLAELRLRGERDYFEFDLRKVSRPQRVGSVALQLRKADVKRQKYTLHLVVDDRTIEKKDKTINEPVQFYQAGFRQPTEIVVNQVYKDRIVGYVSAPKKQETRVSGVGGQSPASQSGS